MPKGAGKKGKAKEDPSEVARKSMADRAEHDLKVFELQAELKQLLSTVDAAEGQLRAQRSSLNSQRSDHADINMYLEMQLKEKRELHEEMVRKYEEQQAAIDKLRGELRGQIDTEEANAETRRVRNRRKLEANEQALAFLPDYYDLLRRNDQASEALALLKAQREEVSQALELQHTYATAIATSRKAADDAGAGATAALLVEMMRAFPESALVQEQAVTMLNALLSTEDTSNAHAFHRAGGVPLLLRALSVLSEASAEVATHACALVWMLAVSSPDLCRDLVVHDSLPLVVNILRKHTGVSRLVYNACGAICHLVVTQPQDFSVAAQIRALPPIEREQVQAHPALTRRTRPQAADPMELRRQLDAVRATQGGAGAPLASASAAAGVGDARADVQAGSGSMRGGSPGAVRETTPDKTRRSKSSSRGATKEDRQRAAASWQHELLTAAIAKLTRSERAELPSPPMRPPSIATELATRERVARSALLALLDAVRAHRSETTANEYALCAVWNLALSSGTIAYDVAHADKLGAVPLLLDLMREHAGHAGIVLYSVAVFLAIVVDVPEAAEKLLDAGARELAQDVARAHPHNERLQDGVLTLVDALERTRLTRLEEANTLPEGWKQQTHVHWKDLSARLLRTFADVSPDRTALCRMLETIRESYLRLAQIFRHYASAADWTDSSIANFLLDVREWNQFVKACRLATRAYDRAQITRVFLDTSAEPKDSLVEHMLNFGEFVEALVRVSFGRLNPFYQGWLLGPSILAEGAPRMVPIDQAVQHTLFENVFPLADMPDADLTQRLIKNEQVDAMLAQHRPTLLKVFKRFAFRTSGTGDLVRLADYMQMVRQAGVVAPGKYTAREARTAFADSQTSKIGVAGGDDDPADATCIDFGEFLECLCRCAISKHVQHGEGAIQAPEAATLILDVVTDVCKAYQMNIFRPTGGRVQEAAAAAAAAGHHAADASMPPRTPPTQTVRLVPISMQPRAEEPADAAKQDAQLRGGGTAATVH